jgi:hypothetical protein
MFPSVGSVITTKFGPDFVFIDDILPAKPVAVFLLHRTRHQYPVAGQQSQSFMIFAPYTALTMPPNWSEAPAADLGLRLKHLVRIKCPVLRFPTLTVSICAS